MARHPSAAAALVVLLEACPWLSSLASTCSAPLRVAIGRDAPKSKVRPGRAHPTLLLLLLLLGDGLTMLGRVGVAGG